MKKTPSWLSTTLSFILVGLLLAVYFVRDVPMSVHRAAIEQPLVTATTLPFDHPLTVGGKQLLVAIAKTPNDQQEGLSGTSSLAPDTGMLFIFPTPANIPFWMKDMHYSLDIIWAGADKKVVDISHDLSPDTYPKTYTPKVPAQYVLEVPAGFASKYGIVLGSTISF